MTRDSDLDNDRFLAMLAHELRNPLAPISNAAQIIQREAAPQSATSRACEVIHQQAGELGRLIEDLLDAVRLMQGKVAVAPEPLTLDTVVRNAVALVAAQVQQRGQAVSIDLPGQAIGLQGDPTRLVQAVANVVHNASKFSGPAAAIAIAATCADGEVRISVKDQGTGIAPEMLPRIFDLFSQAEQSLDRPQGGLGVGLAIARQVVELHGGRIRARSDGPGHGTEVVIQLPALPAADPWPPAAAIAPIATRPRDEAGGAPPVRILVVDDEPASAETLMTLMELMGFEVRVALDGIAAVAAAEAFLPDVVLLDIGLPGLNGFEVARLLRTQPQARDALLIALTGYDDAETRSRSVLAGFDSHMTKPADMNRLLAMLTDPRAARRA